MLNSDKKSISYKKGKTMKIKQSLLSLIMLPIFSVSNTFAGEMMVGGWASQADTSEYNNTILEAVKNNEERKKLKIIKIGNIKTQIVAGVNIKADISYQEPKINKNSCAEIVVYKDLSGGLLITSWKDLKC